MFLNGTDEDAQVVFMQHGLFDAADSFLLNHHEESPALALANEGYDVWLANQRGNSESRVHDKLDPSSLFDKLERKAFFDFSFNEVAEIDLPLCIDFVKNHTGRQNMTFIGHSTGTTSMFYALAEPSLQKTLNESINLFIALAPVTKLEHMHGSWPVTTTAWHWPTVKWILDFMGYYEHAALAARELGKIACGLGDGEFCLWLETWYFTSDSKYEDPDRFQVYMGHTNRGVSTNMMYHLA